MLRDNEMYPPITKRIEEIVNDKFRGNIRQFSLAMGLTDSVKINRLFKPDKRNNEYPIPSTDIIIKICQTFDISADWLLFGKETAKSINNINIDAHKVNGNNNITGNDNNVNNGNLFDVVKAQQEQINQLLNMMGK